MTSIYIYDLTTPDTAPAELPPLPIGALVVGALNLLDEAADLPQPRHISISDTQHVSLQFPPDRPSLNAVTQWALRFGGVLSSEPHEDEHGPQTWCRAEFSYYGVAVDAYAHIPAISHVSYPHQPGRLYDCPACQAQCNCTPGDAECVYDGQHNGMATT